MDAYKYDHLPHKHKIRHGLTVILVTAIIVGGLIGIVNWENSHKVRKPVAGSTVLIPQANTAQPKININEPFFTMQLPSDWKQVSSQAHSVMWQATLKNADNRWLTVYTDVIPTTMPVHRELPITVSGAQLVYGEQSDDCVNFTAGGTHDVSQANLLKPAPSVWQGVNFICNLSQVVDNQIVGTGSAGASVNTFTVTGPTEGTHSYFFYYVDRNIQPDYTILTNAIQSFRAK